MLTMKLIKTLFLILFILLLTQCQNNISIDISKNIASGNSGNTVITKIASFQNPQDLILQNNKLYISDNQAVYEVDTLTKEKLIYAGKPGDVGHVDNIASLSRFRGISSISIDNEQNLYVLDKENNAIRKIDKDKNVSTLYFHNNTKFDRIILIPRSELTFSIDISFNGVETNHITNTFSIETTNIIFKNFQIKEEEILKFSNTVVITNIITNQTRPDGYYDIIVSSSGLMDHIISNGLDIQSISKKPYNLVSTNESIDLDNPFLLNIKLTNTIIYTNISFTNYLFNKNIKDIAHAVLNKDKNMLFFSEDNQIIKIELEKTQQDKGIVFYQVESFRNTSPTQIIIDKESLNMYLVGETDNDNTVVSIPFKGSQWQQSEIKQYQFISHPKGGLFFINNNFFYTDSEENVVYRMNIFNNYTDLVNVFTIENNTNVSANMYLDKNFNVKNKNNDNFFLKVGSKIIRNPRKIVVKRDSNNSKIVYFLDKNALYELKIK